MPVLEKRTVSIEELDAMAAVELPDREMLSLVTILITNVLNNLSVTVTVKNVNIAAQVCAVVNVLNQNIGTSLTCTVQQ
jgi:organic hydroperoxide reductase OsmC/OhrA